MLGVDDESHPDLMWALRGGGGNFGVVTTFTYRLHPLAMITGGLIAHPIDAAPELLRFYRDAVADVSDDLTVFAGLVPAPDGSGNKLSALVDLPRRRPGGRRAGARAVQGVRLAAGDRGRPDALPGDQHDARRGLPQGVAQLLAVELHQGPLRRADRHRGRALRLGPVADDPDAVRALPRRRHARRADRHRRPAPRAGLEPADPVGRGPTRPTPTPTSRGRRRRTRRSSPSCRSGAGSTTSATTRPRTPSAAPTARTTTGYARSSAGTTRTTSSTSTTTSRLS